MATSFSLCRPSSSQNIYKNLNAAAHKTTAGINYKELYDCKWDLMTLTNNILYRPAFKVS